MGVKILNENKYQERKMEADFFEVMA